MALHRMGKRFADLSVARRAPIHKGLIYDRERGVLESIAPGMRRFRRRKNRGI